MSRAVVAALVAAVLVLVLGASAQDAGGSHSTLAKITAPSFVAIDVASGRPLVARGANSRRPIASLTKVMTGLVVIESGKLRDRVRVTSAAVNVEDYREGLVPGRRYRRMTLLRSALMVSANDSATALAIDAGGSLRGFYAQMNARARAIGLTRTTYASPSGLDDVRNLSTALDQARLTQVALKNPHFASIVATKRHVDQVGGAYIRKGLDQPQQDARDHAPARTA